MAKRNATPMHIKASLSYHLPKVRTIPPKEQTTKRPTEQGDDFIYTQSYSLDIGLHLLRKVC